MLGVARAPAKRTPATPSESVGDFAHVGKSSRSSTGNAGQGSSTTSGSVTFFGMQLRHGNEAVTEGHGGVVVVLCWTVSRAVVYMACICA